MSGHDNTNSSAKAGGRENGDYSAGYSLLRGKLSPRLDLLDMWIKQSGTKMSNLTENKRQLKVVEGAVALSMPLSKSSTSL